MLSGHQRISVRVATPPASCSGAYLTDASIHTPPTTGCCPYSPPGSWVGTGTVPSATGSTYVDPTFGATVRRLTNRYPSTGGFDHYVRTGFWNANGIYALIGGGGVGGCKVIEAATATVYQETSVPCTPSDVSFSPAAGEPDKIYYFTGTDLRSYDIDTASSVLVKTFPATIQSLGGSTDFIDSSGRYFVVRYGDVHYVWDKQTDTTYSGGVTRSFGGGHTSITNDATFVVMAADTGWYSYPITHGTTSVGAEKLFWTLCGDHGDNVSPSNGGHYIVVFECNDVAAVYRVDMTITQTAGDIPKQRNDNLQLIDLDWDDAGHFSCNNSDWCWYGNHSTDDTHASQGTWRAWKSEILAINVVTSAVRRFTHHRSRWNTNYFASPRPSASWDGMRAYWASNYGVDTTSYSDIYTTSLDGCAPTAPVPEPVWLGPPVWALIPTIFPVLARR
jgi:hypothetical protein